jgi:predicted RNA-binding Zn-ribbon protein involved in translation (DUF1610 family)
MKESKKCADCGKDMGTWADHICDRCGTPLCAACVAGTHRNDDYECALCRWGGEVVLTPPGAGG